MARKLKTFVTIGGFFELAVAAPSMKAAAELLGVKGNAFSQGFAHETEDAAIIARTMEKPGVVLRRAVGTKAKFAENAELPKLSALQDAMKPKRADASRRASASPRKPKAEKPKKVDAKTSRKAAELYDLAEKRRQREEERAEAQRVKEREHHERATDKAKAALEEARSEHDERAAAIEKEREALERRSRDEDERWEAAERKLKAALRRAEDD
jgi:colicin import membrane protein